MSVKVSNVDEDAEGKPYPKVDLDTILVEEIGQFGRFQLRVLLLNAVAVMFTAWAGAEFVFTTARISTRCLIPECDSAQPEFTPSWVTNAIPAPSGALDNCHRYGNTLLPSNNGSCPASMFDHTLLMTCEQYVYENNNTVVYDFGLACSEWKRSMIGTFRTLATLVNLPLTGYISDRWGRRVALTVNAINAAWVGSLRYFANSYISFAILEFIETALGSEVFSSAFILLLEITGPKYRVAAGCTMHAVFSSSQILLGLIAWRIPYWRTFTLAIYTPMFVCIAYIWLMSESVRFYMSKGKYKELEALLQKIAKTNGRTLSPSSIEALKLNHEEEKRMKELEENQKADEPWLVVRVLRHKTMVLRCIVTPVWWITIMLIFFGLSINAVNISGNRYTNYIAVAAVDIPGYIISVYLMGKIGRKPVIITSFGVCAACMAAYVFLPQGYSSLSLVFYLVGKSSIACVGSAIHVYTAELFPTQFRHSLFAYASMMSKIGSVVAPLTPALSLAIFEKFPFVLFGLFALLSGLLTFLMPETHGVTLPDTMEEAAQLGKQKRDNL